ncbi:DMT family transporter [Halomicroarcula limicola]|uniref:DMT family transporter n=1 Tax=Haloarcula limicola TaxID=1429915 RepID=A0A8J8C2U9_9EURY|nr:DMT family transporter [Halomicroarcula limicola]MBV0923562.1 DMT family transporter [Halomicroarcula limicola]
MTDADFADFDPRVGLAVAVLAVSTSAILVRASDAPASVAAFYRVAMTTLLVAPLALWRDPGAFSKLARRDLLAAAATGVALAVHFAAWFESLAWTSVAASVTLVQSQPLFVAVGAWALLDERIIRGTTVGILLAVGGIVVMSLGELLGGGVGPRPLYGNALALLGGVMAAAYVLAGRSLRQRFPLFPYVTVVYAVAAVCLFAFVLAGGHPVVDYAAREWVLFFLMAVGPGVFGHTVLNWALGHLESSLVSVSLLGEPVGSALLAFLLLSELPGAWTLAGGVVVLAGIGVTARSRTGVS